MAWRLARSLIKLREEINTLYPNRDKTSDGSVGDLSHRARKSDHNPNSANVVTAIDVDKDLAPGKSVKSIVTALYNSRDPRIKYLIFEGKITTPGLIGWKSYHGPNGHFHHVHISVSSNPKLYDDDRPWNISAAVSTGSSATTTTTKPQTPANTLSAQPLITLGMKGDKVLEVQRALVNNGFPVKVDGDFGAHTLIAVKRFQRSEGLDEDGKVGKATRTALGI